MPAITFIPFAPNPDGTFDVYGESLVDFRGRLYAPFSTSRINPETGSITPVITGELYEINTSIGHATPMTPADTNLSALVNVNDTIYGFNAATGQVVTVDLVTGQTKPVSETDRGTGVVVGATPARPAPAPLRQ